MAKKKCFVAVECWTCPEASLRSGSPADIDFKQIECDYCGWNTGECKDCLFEGGEDCPEWVAATTNKRR